MRKATPGLSSIICLTVSFTAELCFPLLCLGKGLIFQCFNEYCLSPMHKTCQSYFPRNVFKCVIFQSGNFLLGGILFVSSLGLLKGKASGLEDSHLCRALPLPCCSPQGRWLCCFALPPAELERSGFSNYFPF